MILGGLTFLIWAWAALQLAIGIRRIEYLENIHPVERAGAPRISVVIPACNEERNIEEALASVLAQDYPDFEVIAVDDRSIDATGAILDRMAERHSAPNPRLRVIHIRELPEGWLGKNHALQYGADRAGGSLLLFTDADVVMEATVLRRAVGYMTEKGIDHLTIVPRGIVGGFLSKAFVSLFGLLFVLYIKPWKVRDPNAPEYVGIGAFNMVRTAAYREMGGHGPIAMRPDDDIRLGKLLKRRGYRQDLVLGTKLLSVEWYPSFREMRNGLMKNLFASLDYRVSLVLASVAIQPLLLVWPFVAVFVAAGAVRWLNVAAVLALFMAFRLNARTVGIRSSWFFTVPLAALIGVYLMLRSMTITLRNGGIEWRGTSYRLEDLRRAGF